MSDLSAPSARDKMLFAANVLLGYRVEVQVHGTPGCDQMRSDHEVIRSAYAGEERQSL